MSIFFFLHIVYLYVVFIAGVWFKTPKVTHTFSYILEMLWSFAFYNLYPELFTYGLKWVWYFIFYPYG